MKFEINKERLPIKAHYFFFMAGKFGQRILQKLTRIANFKLFLSLINLNSFLALGPILPQINVFGRQLGVSPSVMGKILMLFGSEIGKNLNLPCNRRL